MALRVHFFLDIRPKEPYKGDTTALSTSGAKFDVKGESIDEERNEEKGACKKEGCSEEKEVVSRLDSSSSNPRPREIGAVFLLRPGNRAFLFECERVCRNPYDAEGRNRASTTGWSSSYVMRPG